MLTRCGLRLGRPRLVCRDNSCNGILGGRRRHSGDDITGRWIRNVKDGAIAGRDS